MPGNLTSELSHVELVVTFSRARCALFGDLGRPGPGPWPVLFQHAHAASDAKGRDVLAV